MGRARMGEEGNRLADLLNVNLPANPGKPQPWTPPAAPDLEPVPDPVAAEGGRSARDAAAEQAAGSGAAPGPADRREPRAEIPSWDPTEVSGIFEQTIAAAERQLAQVQQALTDTGRQTHEGTSADGAVRVIVDGRPRVVELHVSARAVRDGAGPLGQAIVAAVNAAIRAAQEGANEILLAGLDPGMRAAMTEGLAEAARARGDETERR
jgi:DNA-binding protein YbaB